MNTFMARLVALFWIKAEPHLIVSDTDDEDILSTEDRALHELLEGKNQSLIFRDDVYAYKSGFLAANEVVIDHLAHENTSKISLCRSTTHAIDHDISSNF